MTNNQSPYDSGHDSSYSQASGPGHPLSSRGNSDIDDQVDRYIREQRVATLISDTPSATTPNLPQSHDTRQRDRNIALSHRLLAALSHSITHDPVLLNIARAYIQDIAHSNPANNNTHTNLSHSFRDIVVPTASNNQPISDPLIANQTPYIDEGHEPPPPLMRDSSDDDQDSENHHHYFPSPTTSTTFLPAEQPFAPRNPITPQPDTSFMKSA